MKEWLTANATTWTTLIILIVLILVNAFTKWAAALKLPNVRGLVIGRSLLFPRDGDVAAAVDQAVALL